MKLTSSAATLALVLSSALLLNGCGGGGDDEAGSPTAFSVSPTTLTVNVPTGSTGCYVGYVGTIFVYGGSAPYRLDNTAPDAVQLDRATVDERGGSFNVSFINGICIAPATINIVDKLDHVVTLTLNNKIGT